MLARTAHISHRVSGTGHVSHRVSAPVQGTSLTESQVQGTSLTESQVQGTSLTESQVQGTSLTESQVQGTSLTCGDTTSPLRKPCSKMPAIVIGTSSKTPLAMVAMMFLRCYYQVREWASGWSKYFFGWELGCRPWMTVLMWHAHKGSFLTSLTCSAHAPH